VEDMGRAPVLSVVEVYAPTLALPTPNLAQPPDTVANEEALLVIEQFVAVVGFGFLEDLAPNLVEDSSTQ
jgi:hypothetical protein